MVTFLDLVEAYADQRIAVKEEVIALSFDRDETESFLGLILDNSVHEIVLLSK
jgi:hypothetical protein